jgi:antitoxin component of MazEF toxin-antitoxin module
MEQTVIKVGNSLAVTIPSGFVNERRLKAGQKIYVHADPYKDMIFVSTTKKGLSGITPEFKKWLDQVNKRYSKAFGDLAKR